MTEPRSRATRAARADMVERQVRARGVTDVRVLDAMRRVPRERFVPPHLRHLAYEDKALPIASGQTISQPYIVGFMIEALQLQASERVLEVGTGSGYAAAVLSLIAGEVWTIERHASLAAAAADRLGNEGFENVHVRCGDGTLGWPEHAPFDAIVITAGGPEVPPTLSTQLTIGGRLVMPIGESVEHQRLVRITRDGPDEFRRTDLINVRFVPLIGAEAWED